MQIGVYVIGNRYSLFWVKSLDFENWQVCMLLSSNSAILYTLESMTLMNHRVHLCFTKPFWAIARFRKIIGAKYVSKFEDASHISKAKFHRISQEVTIRYMDAVIKNGSQQVRLKEIISS